ncbi:hypothetical protein ACWEGV_18215, partial [Streptomyces sp. NPDC004976]
SHAGSYDEGSHILTLITGDRVVLGHDRHQGPGQVHLRLEQQNAVKTEHGIAHLKNWRTLARHLCEGRQQPLGPSVRRYRIPQRRVTAVAR